MMMIKVVTLIVFKLFAILITLYSIIVYYCSKFVKNNMTILQKALFKCHL